MKIFDCCIYLDEDFLLDLRFNILNDFVDYFVVVESNRTWQNNKKKFNFDIKKFNKFYNKIIYIKVEDMPKGENPWLFRCEKIFGFENLKGYDSQRLYAYLAERYLSFWFKKYSKYIEWPYTTLWNI